MLTLLPHNEGQAMRRGFTLTEALMAILILGVGLLSLMALYPLAVLHINEALRNNRVAQAVQNARALLEIYHSQLPSLPSAGSFSWWYANGKAPDAVKLGLTLPSPPLVPFPTELDVEGPYQKVNQGTSPTGAPIIYPSPVFTGLRNNPADPVRYTWAYLVRGVDDSQADVTVVVFEDYDPTDRTHDPSPRGVTLTQGDVSAPGAEPAGAWILDAQNGYIYRVAAKGFLELPARATSNNTSNNRSNVYIMPRVVEAIGLGVIRLKP
jgi:prepilin-type N-terminal cleavage/methylation domain-containing protein